MSITVVLISEHKTLDLDAGPSVGEIKQKISNWLDGIDDVCLGFDTNLPDPNSDENLRLNMKLSGVAKPFGAEENVCALQGMIVPSSPIRLEEDPTCNEIHIVIRYNLLTGEGPASLLSDNAIPMA